MPGTGLSTTGIAADADRTTELLQQLRRLLIVRLRNLGDCILMTPVLEILKRWRPELEITVLVEKPFASVFEGNPFVDRLAIPHRPRGILGKYRERLATAKGLRSSEFDLVWNLHGGSTSLLYALSPRSRWVMGFRHYRQASRYTHLVPPAGELWPDHPLHTVLTQLAPLRWLGVPVDARQVRPRVYSTERGERLVEDFLRAQALDERGFVLVQPTATLRTKQWPEGCFAELIRLIRDRCGMQVVLAAGPGEEGVARRVADLAGGSTPQFAGQGLDALKSLLARCACFVGNDSGPMHLAAALQRPVLAIFGSSNLSAWHPWGTDFEVARAEMPCIPCPGYRCYEYDQPRCIRSIRPMTVFQAFCRLRERNAH